MNVKLKVSLLYTFLFFSICSVAQEKLQIKLNGKKTVKQLFQEVESQSDYEFYFVKEWIDSLDIPHFQDRSYQIEELLQIAFENSEINYHITPEKNIILTKNSYIYDYLPKGFYPEPTKKDSVKATTAITNVSPLFYNETYTDETLVETVSIGKENASAKEGNHILSGYAYDAKTNLPIEGLAIVMDKNKGAVTDTNGFYSIDLPLGESQLEIKGLGYQTVKKNVLFFGTGTLDLYMNESLELLDEVVVSAKSINAIEDSSTGSEEIDVEEIKNIPLVLGERDIFKVATTLPGITSAGEGSAGFNVRGGKSDQNLILLDGGVIYNPAHFFGLFSAINPFTTNEVEIYKGHIPAEYGGRLSSVFDIQTKNGNTEKLSAEISIGPVTGNAVVELPVIKEKSSLIIGGRGTYSDWILKSLDDEKLKKSTASFYDGILKYHHKLNEKNNLNITAYHSKDIFSITSDSLYSFKNTLVSAQWDHLFNDKNRMAVSASHTNYTFGITYDENENRDFDFNYDLSETQFKLLHNYFATNKLTINAGLSSKLYRIHPGEISPQDNGSEIIPKEIPQEKGLESAIFIAGLYDVNDNLLIDIGLRYSLFNALGASTQRVYSSELPRNEGSLVETVEYGQNDIIKTFSYPELRFSLRYKFNPDFSIKGSYDTMAQYIHLLSNNTTISPIDTWKLSDLNVKPQKSKQFSLGLYENFDSKMYTASIEGYYKRFKDVLDYKTGAELILNDAIEQEIVQGVGKSYGVEFSIRKNQGRFNGWLNYTYSRSFFKFDGTYDEERINEGNYFPSNFDKPHNINLVTNYKFTRRFSASANFVYQTGRPVTVPAGNYQYENSEYVFYSDRNQYRIPDFYRLDLSFNVEGNHKKKKLGHSFWNISIYNVLGRNNPYSVFFVTENGEVNAYKSSIFSIPIPTITYNLKF